MQGLLLGLTNLSLLLKEALEIVNNPSVVPSLVPAPYGQDLPM